MFYGATPPRGGGGKTWGGGGDVTSFRALLYSRVNHYETRGWPSDHQRGSGIRRTEGAAFLRGALGKVAKKSVNSFTREYENVNTSGGEGPPLTFERKEGEEGNFSTLGQFHANPRD